MDQLSTYQVQLNSVLDLKNVFMMKPRCKDSADTKIAIDYSPMYSEVLGCMLNTVPILNNDGEPSQHGFILQIDQPVHLANSIHYRSQFEKKLQEVQVKNKDLLFPKPRGTKIYCNVCKQYIEDYLQHTESKNHKLKFRKNKVINLIHSMADEFQKNRSMPQNTPTLHSDSDRCGYFSSIQDDSIEHQDSTQQEPHTIKKIKLNEDVNAFNKMGNSLVNSSNQQFNDKYGRQCL
ncbi:unnamed protein product [Paramecium primaurelia]|uniref:DBF4-type domain-containing protein n=1 Tax=Paramecium primaurelia TaxID=5886 RepID=A0A8S1MG60_PARPR|nr:unnamed protein product [Paramecium primaurelia]